MVWAGKERKGGTFSNTMYELSEEKKVTLSLLFSATTHHDLR